MVLKVNYYLENREKRDVLNVQTSQWRKTKAGVPQGINSLCKISADEISTFLSSKVYDIKTSTNH